MSRLRRLLLHALWLGHRWEGRHSAHRHTVNCSAPGCRARIPCFKLVEFVEGLPWIVTPSGEVRLRVYKTPNVGISTTDGARWMLMVEECCPRRDEGRFIGLPVSRHLCQVISSTGQGPNPFIKFLESSPEIDGFWRDS